MALLKMMKGETLQFQLEGDLYEAGSSPITQALASLKELFAKNVGSPKKAKLVVTSQRILMLKEQKICWCITGLREYQVMMPSSVQLVGYRRTTLCGCFPRFHLFIQGLTKTYDFPLKNVKETEVDGYVAKLYLALK